jgi:hypothetical protein
LEARNQPAVSSTQSLAGARRRPRTKLDIEIRIDSRTAGVLKGRTVGSSESGISTLLKVEVPVGEFFELQFALPLGPVTVHATLRQQKCFSLWFPVCGIPFSA